jgi:hypothetical protein
MVRHPEVRRAAIEQWRAQAAGFYAQLFKNLNLSPAQIEEFKDLSALGALGTENLPDGGVFLYSTGGDRRAAETQIHALLGDDGFRQYREFPEVGAPAWQLTTQLAGSLFDTTAPLTAAQGAQMTSLFAESRVPMEGSTRPRLDWEAITTKAQVVLSEPQKAILEIYRAEDEFNAASSEFGRRNRPTPQPASGVARPDK